MKKILILFTSIGQGHKKIAENIGEALKNDYDVDLVDILKFEEGALSESGAALYKLIINYWPGLWRFFYINKFFLSATLPFRKIIAGFKSKKMAKLLSEENYDAVISVHVNSSSILSYLKSKGKMKAKFIIGFSDFHLHPFWVFKNADLFLANIPEQEKEIRKMGLHNKVAVCGITMKPMKHYDSAELRKKYGISEGQKMILVMGGSGGYGLDRRLVSALACESVKVCVVCGTNKQAYEDLSEFYEEHPNVKILGYVEDMQELYSICSVAVTKPGGLSTTECLMFGIPAAIVNRLPGQEDLNYEYLVERKLVMESRNSGRTDEQRTDALKDIIQQVESELKSGEFAESLKSNPYVSQIVQYGGEIKKELTKLF